MFRYTRLQIILHWLLVLLLIVQFVSGDGASRVFGRWLDAGDRAAPLGPNLHVILGIGIAIIALWRLVLHVTNPRPAHDGGALDKLAVAVHWLLYALLLAVPALGALAWFGGSEAMGDAHAVLKTVLMLLVLLHIVGALYHRFILRDAVMARMSLRGHSQGDI